MTLPHFVFFGAGISFKIIFPSVVKWLAYDTYTTALLSVWYPLICTLGWIHEQRHGEKDNQKEAPIDAPSTSSVKQVATTCKADKATPKSKQRQNRKQPAYMKPTSAQKAREGANNTKRGTKTGVFPKTTPTSPSSGGNSSTSNIQEKQPSTEAPTTYWLRYWGVYALVQAIGHLCSMVPVFGRFVARHPFFLSFAAELKLLFFVWIFFMETLLRSTTGDSLLAEALPLRLLHRHVMPLVREFEAVVSEAVPKEAWKNWVHSKVQRLLEVFVMVRFISESSKDWLLHILDESRTLLLPSLSLLMPGFVTQFGVSYVQFLVPSVKSSNAKGEAAELLYLQYWVLHCILSGLFSWFSSILWWIPFSTHLIFLTWCHLSFPQTIAEYYSVVEMDLVAFGLLRGDPVVAVHETRTVQLLASLSKRLPSAVGDDDDVYALKEAESNMTEASKKIDPSISVDSSNESNQIEVSLRKFDLRKSDKQKACDNDIMLEPWPTWEDKENSNDPSEKEKDDTHPDIPASKTSTTQEDDLSESSYDTATGADKNTLKTVRRSTRNSKKTHC